MVTGLGTYVEPGAQGGAGIVKFGPEFEAISCTDLLYVRVLRVRVIRV